MTIVFFYLGLRNESMKIKNIEYETKNLMRSTIRFSDKSKSKLRVKI